MDDLEKIRGLLLSGLDANLQLAQQMLVSVGISPSEAMERLGFARLGINRMSDLINNNRWYLTDCKDLSPLRGGCPSIEFIYLSGEKLQNSDLGIVADCSNLRNLTISNVGGITELAPLRRLQKLESLSISSVSISDISPLADLPNLRTLNLLYAPIEDFSPLARCTRLEHGEFRFMPRLQFGLAHLSAPTLQRLDLRYNQLWTLEGLPPLPRLEWLNAAQNELEDISPLSAQTELRNLFLENNRLPSIDALRTLTHLERINIRENPLLDDISPLFDLPKIRHLTCKQHVMLGQIREFRRRHRGCVVLTY